MRGERATLGKSLLDVQRELKIKATYVAAIENCDVSAFETPGFVAGYVRSYARYLGMDPEWAYGRFCAEANFSVSHGLSGMGGAKPAAPAAAPANGVQKTGSKAQAKVGAKVLQVPLSGLGFGVKAQGKNGQKTSQKATQRNAQKTAQPIRSLSRDPLANPNATFIPRTPAMFTGVEPRALGSLAVLIALIGGLAYGGWAVLQQVQRVQLAPVDQSPSAVADLDPLANVAALPDKGKSAQVTLPANDKMDRLYRPEALDVPVMVARDGPIAAIKPGSLGALSPAADDSAMAAADGGTASATPGDATTPNAAAAAANAAVAALAGQGTGTGTLADGQVKVVADAAPAVQLIAVRPAWVRVRAADGTVLFEKILDAGERYTVPQNEEPATLRAGNSGSVYFMVKGKAYGPAAPGAQVIKNLTLTAQNLEGKYQVADLARNPDLAGAVAVAQAQPQKTPGQPTQ